MAALEEFVQAQDAQWSQITAELRTGRKVTHWIWYVFPQLASLGRSGRARHFGIEDLEEAEAYLSHPVLGPRLEQTARLMLAHEGEDPAMILGSVDALKLRSSMTLFEAVDDAPDVFAEVLDRLYEGSRCPATLEEIGK